MATEEHGAKSDVTKLDCSICLSHFRDPKLLTCFHTFCMQCLEDYVVRTRKDGKFECPLCRTCMDIPVGGVKSFQSNFYIEVESLPEAEVVCDVCENEQKASNYCIDCVEHLCERCAVTHSRLKMTRGHKTVELSDSPESFNRKVQKKTYCPNHNGEEIKMICKDCNALLCVVCKLTEHENHCTSGISKEATERRVLLSEKVKEVESSVKSLKSTIDKVAKCSDEIQKKLETNIKEIDECVEQLVKQIRDDSDKMKQELHTSCTEVLDYYLKQNKILHEKICEGEAVVTHTRNVLDAGSDLHILDVNLQNKLQSSKTTAGSMSVKNMTHLIFKASNTLNAPYWLGQTIRTNTYFKIVKENVISGDPIINTYEANVMAVSARYVYAVFHDYSRLLTYNIETNLNDTELLLQSIEEGSIAGLTFDEKGACFFSHLHSKSLYRRTGKRFGEQIASFGSFPYGIAFRAHNKDSSRELLVCLSETADSRTFECISAKGCIISVPIDKQLRQCVIWREYETPGPTCIAVNSTNGIVCLGYPTARKVTLNSSDGKLLSEFAGAMDFGSPEKFCPTSVCFDINENGVIIADYGNDAVIRIDDAGTYIQCLIKGHCLRPLCVALGIDNKLFVGFMFEHVTCYKLKIQDRL